MTQSFVAKPPLVAAWLVDLFIPAEQAESIPGDLLEEFLGLASTQGVVFARHWYWRQSLKTIAHLVGTAFRVAPFQLVGAVLLGLLLLQVGFLLFEEAIVAILLRHRFPVDAVALSIFWLPWSMQIGRLIVAVTISCIVAAAVKGREMVATMTLALGLNGLTALAFSFKHWQELMWMARHWLLFLPQEVTFFVTPIAIVVAGGIVRKRWSRAAPA
jgi:hypothetical protein